MNTTKYKRRWLLLAPAGLVLIGAGLSMAIDAGFYRMRGAETLNWVAYGTLALIVFNSGISIFGQSVLEKVRVNKLKEKK